MKIEPTGMRPVSGGGRHGNSRRTVYGSLGMLFVPALLTRALAVIVSPVICRYLQMAKKGWEEESWTSRRSG
jgi:hypothetical protein